MSKNLWRFKPSEVQRLVKAAQSMGLKVNGIEVGTDKIKVQIDEPQTTGSLMGSCATGKHQYVIKSDD